MEKRKIKRKLGEYVTPEEREKDIEKWLYYTLNSITLLKRKKFVEPCFCIRCEELTDYDPKTDGIRISDVRGVTDYLTNYELHEEDSGNTEYPIKRWFIYKNIVFYSLHKR